MGFKDILVHLDEGPRSDARMKIAARLAKANQAHLTGLFVIDIPGTDLFYGAGMPFAGGGGMNQMLTTLRSEANARADAWPATIAIVADRAIASNANAAVLSVDCAIRTKCCECHCP